MTTRSQDEVSIGNYLSESLTAGEQLAAPDARPVRRSRINRPSRRHP
jgi:hypothetical protein